MKKPLTPQVDASELLSIMGFLSCQIPVPCWKKKKKSDLVKTVREGDWGEESDTEEPRSRGGDDLETEFLVDS